MPKIFALRNSLLEVQQSIGLDDLGGGGQQQQHHQKAEVPSRPQHHHQLLLGCFHQEEEEIQQHKIAGDEEAVTGLEDVARPADVTAEAAEAEDEAAATLGAEEGEREGSHYSAGKNRCLLFVAWRNGLLGLEERNVCMVWNAKIFMENTYFVLACTCKIDS